MTRPGCYRLYLQMEGPETLRIGRLGTFTFPAGTYVYTGSALGGLDQRLRRHRAAPCARPHWHIDYLLPYARLMHVEEVETEERLECRLNAEILSVPGAHVVAPGFGSSDCRCLSHLVRLAHNEVAAVLRSITTARFTFVCERRQSA